MAKHFFWKPFKEQIADMYEKVTEVLKRQYTYFENVNLFYNGNWLSILSTAQRRADTRVRYLFMSEVCGHVRIRTRVHLFNCQSTFAQTTPRMCNFTLVRHIIYGLYDIFHIIWIILFDVFMKIEFVIPIYLKLTVTARHHYSSSVLFKLICSVHYNNILL